MPKLTIDGHPVETADGATVIQAAAQIGITVPHYCWHAGLTVAGNCRMCLVEIEKMPKLSIACSTQVAEGMVVRTTVERVREARDAVMEFLLINHPLDCPICDQAGECRLQQYSFTYGPGGSRFLEEKVHKPKNVDIGRHIVFDAERCILCTRCVRFCNEVSKTGELTTASRGDHVTIETFPGLRLDNAYSGNTVDLCPVGALTLKEFRFRQRVWFLKDVRSVCASCARGCNVNDGVSAGRILRMTPRVNLEVNRWWMCDEGRLSYRRVDAEGRILRPRVAPSVASALLVEQHVPASAAGASGGPGSYVSAPSRTAAAGSAGASRFPDAESADAPPAAPVDAPDGTVAGYIPKMNEGVAPAPRRSGPARPDETSMADALDAAARLLGGQGGDGRTGTVEMILSSRATNEDLFALAMLARDRFGIRTVALPLHERGMDDDLLIRRDKTPNRAGALAILGAFGIAVESGSDLAVRIGSGSVRAVLALGPNLMGMEIPPVSFVAGQAPGRTGAGESGEGNAGTPRGAVPPSSPPAAPERRYTVGERGLSEALAVAVEASGTPIIVIDAFESPLSARGSVVLPAATYGEIEGTITNFEGRVQRMRAGVAPRSEGFPVYRIVHEIGRRLGVVFPAAMVRGGAQETFSALAAAVPAFSGLSYARLGDLGAPLGSAAAGTGAGPQRGPAEGPSAGGARP